MIIEYEFYVGQICYHVSIADTVVLVSKPLDKLIDACHESFDRIIADCAIVDSVESTDLYTVYPCRTSVSAFIFAVECRRLVDAVQCCCR